MPALGIPGYFRDVATSRELGPPLEPVMDALDPVAGVAGMVPGIHHREDGSVPAANGTRQPRLPCAYEECIRGSCNGGRGV